MRPNLAFVDLAALRHNTRLFQKKALDAMIMAVVKADAYGHGAIPVSEAALQGGAAWLGVATAGEALQLRDAGIEAPVLVIGALMPEEFLGLIERNISLPLTQMGHILPLAAAAQACQKKAKVHIKAETGFHRLGIPLARMSETLEVLAQNPWLELEGLYTHFAQADDIDDGFVDSQYAVFLSAEDLARQRGFDPIIHVCNSAAALRRPELHRDMVRIGISLYGCRPDLQTPDYMEDLRQVMSWKTAIAAISPLKEGETVGYSRAYTADGEKTIATLPLGYGDGYRRCMGEKAHVLIRGQKCPVLGRICMDHTMVDITGLGAEIGDEVVLLGKQGREEITVNQMAVWQNSVPHEVTLAISPRVPRVFADDREG